MAASTGLKTRVLIAVVAATFVIAVAAIPSFGATKKSVVDVKPNLVVGGSSSDFTISIFNTTPGNSTISSFSVNVPFPLASGTPLPGSPVLLPPPDSTNANANPTITVVGSQVRVQNIDPLKTNQSVKLKVTAIPPATPCDTGYAWTATAYAGNSLSGDQFPNQGTIAQRTTTVGCAGIRFVSGHTPQDAVLNTTITNTDLEKEIPPAQPVQVEYVVGGVRQDLDTGTVTLSYGTTPPSPVVQGTLSGNTATFTNGVAEFGSLMISDTAPFDAAGDYTLVATYSPYTTTIPSFRIFDSLLCNGDDYSESAQTDAGQLTIASETPGCFGIIVNNFAGATGTGNVDEWSVIKSVAGGTFIQGTFAINWDLGSGTDPVPWTQVTWDGSGGAYHDVQLCVAGQTGAGRFPAGEQICLLSSELVQNGTHWEQAELFAYNTDLGGRKP
jgi:hypothetical protein